MQDVESLILRLRNYPGSQDSCVLAFECNWERLLQEVDELVTQLGFEYFGYSVFFRSFFDASVNASLKKPKCSDIAGSVPQSIQSVYIRDICMGDPVWQQLEDGTKPLIVSSSLGGNSQANNFWVKQGVKSRVYVPVASSKNRFWFNYFTLYHHSNGAEFNEFFAEISEWLIPMLERYNRLLQVVNEKEKSPFLPKSLLSETCLNIVRMTAEGMPVKRIADKLSLTEEGITYHITRAKKLFKAKNKTQLVALMCEAGLL